MQLKAKALLKRNIDAMLSARGQTRHDLARWCHRSDAWLSKIFAEPKPERKDRTDRGVPLKYLDRFAQFFGVETYQLFQPGISHLTNRRSGKERRTVPDRRISQAVLSEQQGDVDIIHVVRALSSPGRQKAIGILMDILNDELRSGRSK